MWRRPSRRAWRRRDARDGSRRTPARRSAFSACGSLAVAVGAAGVGDAAPRVVTRAAVLRDRLAVVRPSPRACADETPPGMKALCFSGLVDFVDDQQRDDQQDRDQRELRQPGALEPEGVDVIDLRRFEHAAARAGAGDSATSSSSSIDRASRRRRRR